MSDDTPDIRLRFKALDNPADMTCTLNCAHCKLPHPATPAYFEQYSTQAAKLKVSVDQIWWCGRCYLAYLNQGPDMGLPKVQMRCDCLEHDVPPFPKQENAPT